MNITQWNESTKIEPGKFYSGMPNALYHLGPGISKSGLDLIKISPLHYKTVRDNPKPQTPAMLIGSAFHAAILEPELFESEYVADPFPGSSSKAAKEAREQLKADGKIIVPHNADEDKGIWGRSAYDNIRFMADAVRSHPTASILLDPKAGITELACYWVDKDSHKLCKAKADFFNEAHEVITDLKSCASAAMSEFSKHCANFRYHVQDAFYSDGFRAAGAFIRAFIFVAVEKEPPYGVAVYKLSQDDRELGRTEYKHNLEVYRQCSEADLWPGYGFDEPTPHGIRDLYLPAWASRVGVS